MIFGSKNDVSEWREVRGKVKGEIRKVIISTIVSNDLKILHMEKLGK